MISASLSACGGGGGGETGLSSVPPPPAPPPSPPPPPPPPAVTNFDTGEFRRSDGAAFHGADVAWRSDYTGSDQIIAVIDSGIDSDSPEFAGRLHQGSRDVAGNRGIDPDDDHGTNVALIAAGARDDRGVLGIAFDAQLLAIRADQPGSCGVDSPNDPTLGCVFIDKDIAAGVDLAVDAGAAVINLSLGGTEASPLLLDAIGRAADAGVVVVVAAGNDGIGSAEGVDPSQPDPFASSLQQAGRGNVIIVGSVDENGRFSDFSNRAGSLADSFLSARGERICCVYEDGDVYLETVDGEQFVTLLSGTSFAAPQVSGAVALLAQAFPNLTGEEIVEILLTSAQDAGAAGTDAVFGTGILDIAAAISPQGTTRLAGTGMAFAPTDGFAAGSPAMGDALTNAPLRTIILDRYDRAYTLQLGRQSLDAPQVQRLRNAVGFGASTRAGDRAGLAFAVTIAENDRLIAESSHGAAGLASDQARGPRLLAGRVLADFSPNLKAGVAIAQGSDGIVRQLQGAQGSAFAIAPGARDNTGLLHRGELAIAVRHGIGPWGLTISAERGRMQAEGNLPSFGNEPELRNRHSSSSLSIAADRDFGPRDAILSATWFSEEGSLLGAQFNPGLGLVGADTLFLDGNVAHRFEQWRVGGSLRAGVTRPRGAGMLADGSSLLTQAWSLDITRLGTFTAADTLGLRISQPLRVVGGELRFDLPVSYDYVDEKAVIGRQDLSLTPDGREIMAELAWQSPLPIGHASASMFYRRQPGHIANAPDDAGALVRYTVSF